jgi:uncharacterized LabA/DUF88 family protein
VAIPFGNSAFDVVMKLRKRLIEDRKLVGSTFKTYYRNISSIPQQHQTDLHLANVFTHHIASTKVGAVDIQIHQDLQEFKEQHKTPATVVLISGDIDFVKDINDLRFRHRHYTIVIHNPQAKEELLKTANEFISWNEFIEKGPNEPKQKYNLGKIFSPRRDFDKTRLSTMSSRRPPLMDMRLDKPTVNTDDNVLESTSANADQLNEGKLRHCPRKAGVLKSEAPCQKKHHKNEKGYVSNKYCWRSFNI